jgi:DNA-binding transcriptional LysR family regulator
LAGIDAAEAEISAKTAKPAGLLRISAPMQIGRNLIAPLIAEFNALYPEIRIEFILSDDQPDVVEDDIDVSIRIGLPAAPDVMVRKLLSSRRVVCATPDYLARHGTPQTPQDLHDHNCLCLMRRRRMFNNWLFIEDGQHKRLQVSGNLATSSGEVLHAMIRAGRGIGLKALWDIQDDIDSGALIELLPDYAADDIDLYATFEKHRFMPPRIRVFLDFIGEHIRPAAPR